MATLKITGVDEGTAQFVVGRSKALHFKGQAEYLRNLIREDMARARSERKDSLLKILTPLHDHVEDEGYTDEELAAVFEQARNEVASARKNSRATTKQ
jgi:hypothetical protein